MNVARVNKEIYRMGNVKINEINFLLSEATLKCETEY